MVDGGWVVCCDVTPLAYPYWEYEPVAYVEAGCRSGGCWYGV